MILIYRRVINDLIIIMKLISVYIVYIVYYFSKFIILFTRLVRDEGKIYIYTTAV